MAADPRTVLRKGKAMREAGQVRVAVVVRTRLGAVELHAAINTASPRDFAAQLAKAVRETAAVACHHPHVRHSERREARVGRRTLKRTQHNAERSRWHARRPRVPLGGRERGIRLDLDAYCREHTGLNGVGRSRLHQWRRSGPRRPV